MHPTESRIAPASGTDLARVRRAGAWLAASLSFGAAAIHLAAGGEHVEALGDLGLGFYWAAVFQAVIGAALLSRGVRSWVPSVAIAGNLAILGAWGLSRSLGLPTVPGGPESIGLADGVAATLQALLVSLLIVRRRGTDASWVARRPIKRLGRSLGVGLGAAIATIALSTVMAVGAVAADHGHADEVSGTDGAAPHGHGASPAP
ncbi:MAG: hypothetical protein ACSLFN_14710 [Candidatus Limnocylindrales bacterium]